MDMFLTPENKEALDSLLNLGVPINEAQARALLEKHHWEPNAAAAELFSDPAPALEFHPPSPAAQPVNVPPLAAWGGAATNKSLNFDTTRSVNATVPQKGALNARTLLPPAIVPSQLKNDVIDLTGEDDDDQLRQALAASLELPESQGDDIVIGPKNRGDSTPLQPLNGVGPGMTQEEQALSRALEASLTTSLNADVYKEHSPRQLIRSLGFPATLRTRNVEYVHVTLLLQALFAVPQIREAFSRWQRPRAIHPDSQDLEVTTTMECLQKIFALMDLTDCSAENIDDALRTLPRVPQLHPSAPGDDMKELYDLRLALLCETAFGRQGMMSVDPGTQLMSRLVLSRTGYEEKDIREPPGLDVGRHDIGTLEVITASTDAEPNTLEVAIFNHLLKPPVKSFLVRRAAVLAVRVNRHDAPLNNRVPLTYPKTLFLDPFMWENRSLVLEKVQEIERAQDNIDKINQVTQYFAPQEDRDAVADLKQTIFYLENVADTKGDGERAAKLAAMAGKLKNALARIEDELTNCNKQMSELRDGTTAILGIPELQKHPYELRAILVHDGLVGREHQYAYLRNPSTDEWFRCCDASATKVSEDVVLSEASGLHLNAGPYFFLYSEASSSAGQFAPWPEHLLTGLQKRNAQFKNSVVNSNMALEQPDVPSSSSTDSGRASRGSSRAPSEPLVDSLM